MSKDLESSDDYFKAHEFNMGEPRVYNKHTQDRNVMTDYDQKLAEIRETSRSLDLNDPSSADKFQQLLEDLGRDAEQKANYAPWLFTLAYVYKCKGEHYNALLHFELAASQGYDAEDVQPYIDECKRMLSLPIFERPFAQRVTEAWNAFVKNEATLRKDLEEFKETEFDYALSAHITSIIRIALSYADMTVADDSQGRGVLCMSVGRDVCDLFRLTYFASQMPESLKEHWAVLPAIPRDPKVTMSLPDGETISAVDIQVAVEVLVKDMPLVFLHTLCPKLTKAIKLFPAKSSSLQLAFRETVEKFLGEVCRMRYVDSIDIYHGSWPAKLKKKVVLLCDLPHELKKVKVEPSINPDNYQELSATRYKGRNTANPEGQYRYDITSGTSSWGGFANCYFSNAFVQDVDFYHDDGIAVGFFAFDVEVSDPSEKKALSIKIRQKLEDHLAEVCGDKYLLPIGRAEGKEYCYFDFVAWDLGKVIDAAKEFFVAQSEVNYAIFHSHRSSADAYVLKAKQ